MTEDDVPPEMLDALDELRADLDRMGCRCQMPWPFVRMTLDGEHATHQHGPGCPLHDEDNRYGALN